MCVNKILNTNSRCKRRKGFTLSIRMCSEMGSNFLPAYFAGPDWIEGLLQEYEEEGKIPNLFL